MSACACDCMRVPDKGGRRCEPREAKPADAAGERGEGGEKGEPTRARGRFLERDVRGAILSPQPLSVVLLGLARA